MKIGVIGSGIVGQQLGIGLTRLGHEVKIGTRDVSKLKDWLKQAGKKSSVGSNKDAASFGEVIFLCTAWTGTENAINLAGKTNFAGKVVIDVTNPLDFSQGSIPRIASTPENSAGAQVQKWLPDSKVVKAFNIINAHTMIQPKREEGMPDLIICGNDKNAKKVVSEFAKGWGWESIIDIGDISKAYWLEALTMLWVEYGFQNNSWTHAFKLLKK
jgi:hypothetical protein